MTREELVEAVEKARNAKNVAVAEVSAAHSSLIEEAERALISFDESAVTDEEVEAVVEAGGDVEEVVEEVTEEVTEVIAEDDENSPTAEEEEILRRAAEIEAKYQR